MTGCPHADPAASGVRGSAILAYGFRPFFFLAGLSALLGLGLWLADLAGVLAIPTAFTPLTWHVHEMLFGFAVAAIAGFLLTALPNWTGRLPLQGGPLLGLVSLWLAGRLAVAVSAVVGAWAAAAIDLAFLAVLLFVAAREVLAGKNWHNLPILLAMTTLLVADGLMHAEALDLGAFAATGWRLAISTVILLIALIGGRIVPSFTRNWLAKRSGGALPVPFGRLDRMVLGVTVVALAAWTVIPGTSSSAVLAAIAAALNAVRLCRWRGYRTLADPLVFVLHVGYAWVPVGLGLLALAQGTDLLPESAAVHGLTAGAIGTMTLAVMTRAARGHTGRELRADAGTTAVYVLVTIAATARIAASASAAGYGALMWIAGAAWIAAFAGFLALYGPMLLRPRIDGRPG